jgi:DNA-binding response OmpR family regulator
VKSCISVVLLCRVAVMRRGLEWLSGISDRHPDAIIVDVSTDSALGWVVLKNIKSKKFRGDSCFVIFIFPTSQEHCLHWII